MKGLTSEQEELLRDAMESETWNAFLALCEVALQNPTKGVLEYDLNQGSRQLVILKARLEGARSLVAALHSAKKRFKIED
jgi:hypothetical protein